MSLVVIPCGAKKLDHPAHARDLYTGGGFRLSLKAAEALKRNFLILSAKYGLIGPFQTLAPYDLKMGDRGSVGSLVVMRQAQELGVLNEHDVTLLLPKAYARVALDVWPWARWLFDVPDLRMGKQRQMLASIAATGKLP